jgi:hypothetical protein
MRPAIFRKHCQRWPSGERVAPNECAQTGPRRSPAVFLTRWDEFRVAAEDVASADPSRIGSRTPVQSLISQARC